MRLTSKVVRIVIAKKWGYLTHMSKGIIYSACIAHGMAYIQQISMVYLLHPACCSE